MIPHLRILVCILILWSSWFIPGLSDAAGTGSTIHFHGGRLTLDVYEQPLAYILQELANEGVSVHIDPRINPLVSATFTRRPIGSALSRILRTIDHVLIWENAVDRASKEPRLSEIRIFRRGQESQIRPLVGSKNLSVAKQGDGTYQVKDILLLELNATMTMTDLTLLAGQLGATILNISPQGIVQLRLPPGSDTEALALIAEHVPGVQNALPDHAYPLKGSLPVVLDRSFASVFSSTVSSMTGTGVAVMDSGIGTDYENRQFVAGVFDAVSPGTSARDQLGHGTQMALIASGQVNPLGLDEATAGPGSSVVAIRGIDDNGFTSNYTMIRAIDYAIEKEARVLSLSWGADTPSPLMEAAIRYATDKGLIVVAAAGNAHTGEPVYPAAYPNVIGVGALTPNGEPWKDSNFGDFVAYQAPGMADLPVGYQGDPGVYIGTSIATAYTARRIAAILKQNPEADLATILLLLSH